MNYAWDVALKAELQGIKQEDLHYYPAKCVSPYIEVAFENINEMTVESTVEINPLYRFSDVFSRVFDINLDDFVQLREILFDIMMHYFVKMDLRQGLCKDEYYQRFLLTDLINGCYGIDISNTVDSFSNRELKNILLCMLNLFRTGTSVYLFRKVMRSIYPESLVYSNNDVFREVLIYIGCKETSTERRKIDFLISSFLPVNYETHLFWEHHFGIIDIDITMMFDQMQIF